MQNKSSDENKSYVVWIYTVSQKSSYLETVRNFVKF